MASAVLPFALAVLALCAFAGLWLVVCAILSELSGWPRLARAFPGGARPPGKRIRGQVVGIGLVGENNVTGLIPTAEGLYIYSHPLFRFRRPPILVPWTEVHYDGERGALWWRSVGIDLGRITMLRLRPKAFPVLAPYLAVEPRAVRSHV